MNHLKGKKILITKSAEDCGSVFNNLIAMGAEVTYFPTIKIIPTYSSLDLTELISSDSHYDYIVFTSPNAVEVFADLVEEYKPDLSRTKVAVVGSSTAQHCYSNGILIHIIPQEFSTKGLLNKFYELDIKDKRILLPVSSIAGEELQRGLEELGALVTRLNIYNTITTDPKELQYQIDYITKNKPDLFAFTSPSSYKGFINILSIDDYQNYFQGKIICAIGSTTEEAIRKSGVIVNIVPNNYSLRGISEAISTFYSKSYNVA